MPRLPRAFPHGISSSSTTPVWSIPTSRRMFGATAACAGNTATASSSAFAMRQGSVFLSARAGFPVLRTPGINTAGALATSAGSLLLRAGIYPRTLASTTGVRAASTSTPPPPVDACDKVAAAAAIPPAPVGTSLKRRVLRGIYYLSLAIGLGVMTVGLLVAGLFLYDSTTYKELSDVEDIEISTLALHPRIGGPKNLPILERYLGDEDCEVNKLSMNKPRLVVLGSGWGAVAMLKNISPHDYHITVISPRNHFLFTPMLPSATVGTLEFRSLVEPIRRIVARVHGHYLKARAEGVEFKDRLVEVAEYCADGTERRFYVPYDKLVIAVGSESNTHGVEGLQYCHFLKTIEDAVKIRSRLMQNLELACLPGISDDERERLLSFVVCGGGPTGVEFAAEVYDLLNEDLTQSYPKVLRNLVSVHVVQSQGHILNTYDEKISTYAQERFKNDSIDVLTNARVVRVEKDRVIFTQENDDGEKQSKVLPYGLCLWSTGVAQCDISRQIASEFSEQRNKRAIETDSHLRVIGAPLGEVYAIGDCSTVRTNITEHIVDILNSYAVKANTPVERCEVTFNQWRDIAGSIKRRFPQSAEHLRRVDLLFTEFDKDHSGTLGFAELTDLLNAIDSRMTSLPATAQRAHQQGQYLGRKFTRLARMQESPLINAVVENDPDDLVYKPFSYHHLGSLAYIGNAAVFDFNGYSFVGGLVAMYLWRSVYFAQSVSFRTRALLFMDWMTRGLFGRDMSNFESK
ncbi:uncharacterized protein V1518DRAFT_412749 [Limtongia smithiae]|uniref:uncharacterized protein n=1 Tax=Limtongia smithiae TaxID=1125753 RepID=UPI0034CFFB7C